MGPNLTQDEITSLEEIGFVFNECLPMIPWSLFNGESFVTINWLLQNVGAVQFTTSPLGLVHWDH
jgi:hypothetical protein